MVILANAGTISNLSSCIGKAGPGGQVLLRADQGAFISLRVKHHQNGSDQAHP